MPPAVVTSASSPAPELASTPAEARRERGRFETPPRSRGDAAKLPLLLLAAALAAPCWNAAAAAPVQATEYQLKAAVLGNLAKFVEWPPSAFASPDSPIVLGILGDDPFGDDLPAILKSVNANGRTWNIRRASDVSDLTSCHIIFVSSSQTDRLTRILAFVAHLPILTVGETPQFLEAGGVINFLLEDKRVRFEINRAAARTAGLSLNAQLLRLAKSVRDAPSRN